MVYAQRRTMRIKVGDGLHGPCPKPKGQDKQVALAQQRPKTENDNQNEQIFAGSANPDARLPSLTRHLPSQLVVRCRLEPIRHMPRQELSMTQTHSFARLSSHLSRGLSL